MNICNSDRPFFTIVIPAYNAGKYLSDAVASVRAQTFPSWECIIVDDGSTDGTGALADALRVKDARIRVIHQANAGVGPARNVGVKAACGTWLLFLDADDAFHSQTLACLEAVVRHDLDFVDFGSVHCAARPELDGSPYGSGTVRVTDMGEMLTNDVLGTWTVWNVAYRRDVVQSVSFAPWLIAEDTLYRLNIACRVRRYARLDLCLHWYRIVFESAYQSGLTPAKVTSQLHSYLDMADCLAKTGRPIESRLRRKIGNAIVCRTVEQLFGPLGGITDAGREALASWRSAVSAPGILDFLPRGLRLMARLSCALRVPELVFFMHILPYRCVRAAHAAINRLRKSACHFGSR